MNFSEMYGDERGWDVIHHAEHDEDYYRPPVDSRLTVEHLEVMQEQFLGVVSWGDSMSTVETDLNDPREFLLFSHWRSPTVYGSASRGTSNSGTGVSRRQNGDEE